MQLCLNYSFQRRSEGDIQVTPYEYEFPDDYANNEYSTEPDKIKSPVARAAIITPIGVLAVGIFYTPQKNVPLPDHRRS